MSNEFVMVPRDWAQNVVSAGPGECVSKSDISLLIDALDKPAEQHQGEPVALPQHNRITVDKPITSDPQGFVDGWNACVAQLAKLGPLYTHADTGETLSDLEDAKEACAEIERTGTPGEVIREMNDEMVDLRAKLAERDALLTRTTPYLSNTPDLVQHGAEDLAEEIRSASAGRPCYGPNEWGTECGKCSKCKPASAEPINDLCAEGAHEFVPFRSECVKCGEPYSAEPSAPVEIDERAEFEACFDRMVKEQEAGLPKYCVSTMRFGKEVMWEGWQARAALEKKA